MIKRVGKNLSVLTAEVPSGSVQLERDGYTVLRDVLTRDEIDAIAAEIDDAFDRYPAERGREDKDEFRYEMLNRGAASQAAVGHDRILEVIEPLLGNDCHVIANTAWRNPADFGGGPWHCDAGPHVPRPEGVEWDDRIPYPVFAIGAHLLLKDCPVSCGPTAVIPGSHRSGRLAPFDRLTDPDLTYDGRAPVLLEANAGRRRAVRVGRVASRHAGERRRRSAVPAVSLRPARHRAAHPHDRRGEPSLPRGDRASADATPARPRRPAPPLLLRRVAGVR